MTNAKSKVLRSLRHLVAAAMLASVLAISAQAQAPATYKEPTYTEGELLIQVSRYVDAKAVGDAFPIQGLRAVELLSPDMNIWLYSYDDAGWTKEMRESFLEDVRDNYGVLLAQFNHHVTLRATIPNDAGFGQQYCHNNTGQSGGTVDADMDSPEAWDITTGGTTSTGDEIVVAIVDGGCDLAHPDINYWKNSDEIPSNGIDDDANGYIDDYDGWDAYAMDGSVPSNSHGTHCAGIAAARGNNGIGVTGVSWNCKVMPVAGSSGTESIVVRAYAYVLKERKLYNQTNGAQGTFVVATNSSFGVDFGQPANFPLWCAYYDSLGNAGVLNACATANQNINVDTNGDIPTACGSPYMISVTNTTRTDARNSGAAYGLTTIDLGAAGTDVYSTLPGASYGNNTGTSMATPQVCGAIGLLWSEACVTMMAAYKQNPGALALVMRDFLLDGVDPKPSLAGITVTGGRLNVYNSLLLVQSYPCGVSISHTGLTDTKEIVNPYPVVCNIAADAALVPDSLFLKYTINFTPYLDTLVTTGNPNEYVGYIPAQSPGTEINYYLEAHAINGKADTTATYSFRVIDYAMLLTPSASSTSGAVDDTVFHNFTLTNDGLFNDSYNLSLTGVNWATGIYDNAGTSVISSTGTLAPNAIFNFKVRVIVPLSSYGQQDTSFVTAVSVAEPLVTKTSSVRTTSAGQPLTLPFVDTFPTTTLEVAKWVYNTGATIDGVGTSEPSALYSLRLNGSADTVMSQAIDMEVSEGVNFSYAYERTGGGSSPETGDDLIIEYFNDQGNWVELSRQFGSGADMTAYATVTIGAPLDAYHSAFRLRLRSVGASDDDWFVDDIGLDFGPEIAVNHASFDETVAIGDSTNEQLIISNSGLGGLNYSLVLLPDFSKRMQLFSDLAASGQVNPASYATEQPLLPESKAQETSNQRGPEVVYDAGGPDNFGYYWVDSDQPGGPVYNWVDIEGTGTQVTGLADDNFVGPFPIGFSFAYYDSVYTQFYIASNGYIGFGPTTDYDGLTNGGLPSNATPNNAIYWCWDDLNILDTDNPGGKVLYQVVGSDLVIQFEKYPEYNSNAVVGNIITAQIILSPSGNIKIQYESAGANMDLLGCTIGMENKNGLDGLQVALNAAYIHAGLAVEFTKPAQWLYLSSLGGSVAPGTADTIDLLFSSADLDTGIYKSKINIYNNDPVPGNNPLVVPAKLTVTPPPPPYTCGDCDNSTVVNISDAVYLIAFVFSGGPAPNPLMSADADCSGGVSISDAVYLIAYVFSGGPSPCAACK
ncbi:MAG: S8 family serine peptidase [bacterium]|nr:S8 family serine peptidase [bacterium]